MSIQDQLSSIRDQLGGTKPLIDTLVQLGVDPLELTEAVDMAATLAFSSQTRADALEPPTTNFGTGLPPQQRYKAICELGQGGMGAVMLANDLTLGRKVALKTMRAETAQDTVQLQRFVNEAQVTGRLDHPNIPPVYELGRNAEGAPYISMKRVKGDALDKIISNLAKDDLKTTRKYTLRRRLNLFLGICNGVAFAHDRGVLHRDLKPANIMVGAFGETLVMDWGLAKVMGAPDLEMTTPPRDGIEPSLLAMGDSELTMAGSVLGTPRYMSPEQARGEMEQVDHRADVFSLGAILYELLVLRPAIGGRTVWEVLELTSSGTWQPPGSQPEDPPVPHELVSVVNKAMAVTPARRYQSVAELSADIEAYLEGRALEAAHYTPMQRVTKWITRNKIAAVGMLAGVVMLVAGMVVMRTVQDGRRVATAEKLVELAREDHAAGDHAAAQQRCLKAMALAPDVREAQSILAEAAAALEAQRRHAAFEGRRKELRAALATQGARVAKLEANGRPTNMPDWISAQSDRLQTARELMRLDDENGKAEAILAARLMARELSRSGNAMMGAMMLREARALGLDDKRFRLEQRMTSNQQRKLSRVEGVRAASIISGLSGAPIGGDRARAAEAELARMRTSDALQVLMSYALGGAEIQRIVAVSALGLIGDTQTRARLTRNPADSWHEAHADIELDSHLREEAATIKNVMEARHGGAHDSVDLLRRVLLQAPVTYGRERLGVAAAQALARFADPRARWTLHLKRWASGRDSLFWRRTEKAYGQLPEPEDIQSRLGAAPPVLRALYLQEAGKLDAAIRAYDEALGNAPRDSATLVSRGWCRLETGDAEAALRDADVALGIETSSDTARHLRGAALIRLGKSEDGLRQLADSRPTLQPGRPLTDRARALAASGKHGEAVAAATAALHADPLWFEAHVVRSRSHAAAGRPAEALADAVAATRLVPGDVAAHKLAASLLQTLGMSAAAVSELEAARREAPRDFDTLRSLGASWLAQTRYPRGSSAVGVAKELLGRAVRMRPADSEALVLHARSLLVDGRPKEALAQLEAATRRGARDLQTGGWLGLALVMVGRQDEGLAQLEGLGNEPALLPLIARASVRFARGDRAAANADVDRAAKTYPFALEPHLQRAQFALLEGQGLDAPIGHLTTAVRMPRSEAQQRQVARRLVARLLATRASQRARAGERAAALADVDLAMRYVDRNRQLRKQLEQMRASLRR